MIFALDISISLSSANTKIFGYKFKQCKYKNSSSSTKLNQQLPENQKVARHHREELQSST
jgi:hypothetical protein